MTWPNVHEMDARVGGYRMSCKNLGNGQSPSLGDTFLELVEAEIAG